MTKTQARPQFTATQAIDPDKADFLVERDNRRGIIFYTPQSHDAYDWAHGTPEGAATPRNGALAGVQMFGRSFMFSIDNKRAYALKNYLSNNSERSFTVASRSVR